ncbi:Integral membrane protein [Pyrenophora tritici-repentis]|nr:Integral membrane protein [Pyrenophora tritici-repentis]
MEDRSGQVLGIALTFLVLAWVTVGLRCYVRTFMVKGFGIDDYTMLLTLCFFTSYLVCQIGGALHGTGIRREKLTDANAQIALHFWFFCEIFYTLSTCMLKISVGFFLLRITIVRLHLWIIRFIMVVSAIVGVAESRTLQSSSSSANPSHIVSGLNSFADWVFAVLPVLIVKDLQMKKRMKFVVAGVIALAAIGCTATIARLPYTRTLKGYKGDFLYRTTDFAIWSTVEVGLGITAGSIATLRPLLKQAFEITRSASAMPWSKPSLSSGHMESGKELSNLNSIQKINHHHNIAGAKRKRGIRRGNFPRLKHAIRVMAAPAETAHLHNNNHRRRQPRRPLAITKRPPAQAQRGA